MHFFLAFPFVLALLAPGAHAGFFDYERCFDDDGHRIDCPDNKEFEIRKILSIALPFGLLFLLCLGLSICCCVKTRRAKRALNVTMEAPGGGPIPPYNVAAPQMEQGYAGQWTALAPQHVPNPFADGHPYAQQMPPGPPPTLALGGSYTTDPAKGHDGYTRFEEVKINS